LSVTCHPKDSGPNQVLSLCQTLLRFCRSGTGLGPDMSFDTPASPEYVSSLARASLAEIPRLPSEGFVMCELPDDAIGVYHRIFDSSGVRILFSSFLLSLSKRYKAHFS
ncbi:hypothetical protein Tco_0023682, partial [Tanacetum coccineum]